MIGEKYNCFDFFFLKSIFLKASFIVVKRLLICLRKNATVTESFFFSVKAGTNKKSVVVYYDIYSNFDKDAQAEDEGNFNALDNI